MLRRLLAHPLAREIDDLDHPACTMLRRRIIAEKGFLRKIYREWYGSAAACLPNVEGPVLELGSGAGFLDETIPGVITSDVLPIPGLSMALDAHFLPFARAVLRAVVMVDVLHHLAKPRLFLGETARCVKPGGTLIMIEPWVTRWSAFVLSKLHHEPFDMAAEEWEFVTSGPLTGANQALPWIIFERDRERFAAEFPEWQVRKIQPTMPFSYLLSGGLSFRSLAPGGAFGIVRRVEKRYALLEERCAMFALIVLERLNSDGSWGG